MMGKLNVEPEETTNRFRQFKAISTSKFNPRPVPAWVHLITLALGAALFYAIVSSGNANRDAYKREVIRGVVERINGFSRGAPRVIISGNERLIYGPSDFGKYLALGDSLVKLSGTETVTTFREKADSVEAIEWKYIYDNEYHQSKPSIVKWYLPKK